MTEENMDRDLPDVPDVPTQASDRLESLLADSLESTQEFLSSASGFAMEQAPELLCEVLLYYRIYHSVHAFALLFVFVFCALVANRFFRAADNYYDPGLVRGFSIMGASLAALPLAFSFSHAAEALKTFVAPRLFLLEKVAELI